MENFLKRKQNTVVQKSGGIHSQAKGQSVSEKGLSS
jgi:hypothetical protein